MQATASQFSLELALEEIAKRAQQHDLTGDWPALDLAGLNDAGALRWAIPKSFGGYELPPYELHLQYEKIATASVATALILTQRDSAAGLIESSIDAPKRVDILNRLSENQIWSTVGIAQLTTSRQGGAPAVRAERIPGGFVLTGTIPWCTGLNHSSFIVAGAAMPDGQQILVLLKPDLPGVTSGPPLRMVALNCTHTGPITLNQVYIQDEFVLRPPVSSALAERKKGVTLGQTFIATGLTQSALNLIAEHDSDRGRSAHARFAQQLQELRQEIAALCQPGREADASDANARLRGACNDLALRCTHAAIALYKGAALLQSHPAQRLSREAMFLLVWSCPNPVIDCTIDLLSEK
jgi:alkylation response protein AidB-like acyl-CoA dehydrogenase